MDSEYPVTIRVTKIRGSPFADIDSNPLIIRVTKIRGSHALCLDTRHRNALDKILGGKTIDEHHRHNR